MPGIPLVSREVNYSRDSDQMCRQEPRVLLSQEEQTAAEESLSVYCKPVELYNILQRRAVRNVTFSFFLSFTLLFSSPLHLLFAYLLGYNSLICLCF